MKRIFNHVKKSTQTVWVKYTGILLVLTCLFVGIFGGFVHHKQQHIITPEDSPDISEQSIHQFPDRIPDIVFHGDRTKKTIALTFDADMTEYMKKDTIVQKHSSYNPQIIEILEKTHTKATFFLTGMWIEMYPELTKQLAKNPLFELGNHSYSHRSFYGYCYGLGYLSDKEKEAEIIKTNTLLAKIAEKENTLFRFPGGCYGQGELSLLKSIGETAIQWDVISGDAFNSNTQTIITNVLSKTQNGSIIVMHVNGIPTAPKTADALEKIIPALQQKGFTFVTVSELLSQ